MYKLQCVECFKPFTAKRARARYCSDACKMRHFRRGKRVPGQAELPWATIVINGQVYAR